MSNFQLVLLVILMTLLGAFGGLGLKKGAGEKKSFIALAFNPWFIGGGVMYLISALLDIWLLKHLPYVVVLPLTSLTYGWSMFLAWLILHERISVLKILGVALIISGMITLVI